MSEQTDRTAAEHDLMQRITQFSELIRGLETTDPEKLRFVVLDELNRKLTALKTADHQTLAADLASADRMADAYNLLFQQLYE